MLPIQRKKMDDDKMKMLMRIMMKSLTTGMVPFEYNTINKGDDMEEFREDLVKMYKKRLGEIEEGMERYGDMFIPYMKKYVEWYEERSELKDKLKRVEDDNEGSC